ncbi:hypothetical protein Dimus_038459 [Dionaea muscipula]
MLCKRFKMVLSSIIDLSQAAFVPGRLIVDNVLLCQELLYGYERKHISPRCMAKVDLRKAYDSVRWGFIEELLGKLGFPVKFTKWVMACVSSTSFTFMLNGELQGFFLGQRGLRQGDPLSPYLFVVVMEYLARSLKKMSRNKDFHFHPKCKKLGLVSVCFADDLMIFAKADSSSLLLVNDRLSHFGRLSGLHANLTKSALYFGGIVETAQSSLAALRGFGIGCIPFRYLGVPLSSKKLQIRHYRPLIEKITGRITSWTARFLSLAGRLQLIRSVLLSIHVYWSQIFLIPKTVLQEIEGICRAFFWSGTALNRKKALVAWDDICYPKLQGGLGIKHLGDWNQAILCKLLWDIDRKKDRVWIRWVAIYYLDGASIWSSPAGRGSWVWMGIMKIRDRLLECLRGTPAILREISSTAKAYSLLHGSREVDGWWRTVWAAGLHPRISLLLWLVSKGRLLTRDRLQKFGVTQDTSCVLCDGQIESCDQLFFLCPFVQALIKEIDRELHLGWRFWQWEECRSWLSNRARGNSLRAKKLRCIFGSIIMGVWWERNRRIFDHERQDHLSVAQKILILYRKFSG